MTTNAFTAMYLDASPDLPSGDSVVIASDFEDVFDTWSELSESYDHPLMTAVADFDAYMRKISDNAITIRYLRNGNLAGALSMYANDCVEQTAYITQLAVSQFYKRLGIGAALLRFACKEALSRKMLSIELEVAEDNETGLAFYDAMGFIATGIHGQYGIILTKQLY